MPTSAEPAERKPRIEIDSASWGPGPLDEAARVERRAAFSGTWLLCAPSGCLLVVGAVAHATLGDLWLAGKSLVGGIGLIALAGWAKRVWRSMP